jgi:hypothetical protein
MLFAIKTTSQAKSLLAGKRHLVVMNINKRLMAVHNNPPKRIANSLLPKSHVKKEII